MPRKPSKPPQQRARPGRTSLRAFAPIAGISQPALTKAIRNGRLAKSVGRDSKGRPFISDPAGALVELREQASQVTPAGNGVGVVGPSLAEAQRRVMAQREIALDLTNRQRQGDLVDAREAERRYFEEGRTIREAMLAIPDRYASQLAAESSRSKVHEMLEDAILSTLTALADSLEDDRVH